MKSQISYVTRKNNSNSKPKRRRWQNNNGNKRIQYFRDIETKGITN